MEAAGLLSPGGRSREPAIRGLMATDAPRQREVVSTKRRWYEQPSSIMVATIAAIMVFGAVIGSDGENLLSGAPAGGRAPERLAVGTAWKGNGTTRTITMEEMLEVDSVRTWLDNIGVVWDDLDDREKMKFLPSRMTVYVDLEGIEDGGTGASGGYVAFNVANNQGSNASKYFSSFLIVMDYASGDIELMLPTFDAQSYPGLAGGDMNTTFLVLRQESYWIPAGGGLGNSINAMDAATGERVEDIGFFDITQDINHLQLVEHDTRGYLSSRLTSAVLRVNITTGGVDWIAGGESGTLTVENLDGTIYTPGSSELPFYGQHNAEYFGENEIFMVDNQYDESSPSFFRVYEVDEAAMTMRETWNYAYSTYPFGNMPFYGDLDRLPTTSRRAASAEFYVSEIDRSDGDKVVWEAAVYGLNSNDCEKTGGVSACARNSWGGWRAYSAERVYLHPLVFDATCRVDKANNTVLRFSTVNSIKQNDPTKASFRLEEQGEAGRAKVFSGDFTFVPHWRTTEVIQTLATSSLEGSLFSLTVTNEWDAFKTTDVQCIKADPAPEATGAPSRPRSRRRRSRSAPPPPRPVS
ncbi:voltage-gated potassium channel [Aureococcus anophagefferens]|nr:voltage-gated potassium channel [Aureococcus anophagefferens]